MMGRVRRQSIGIVGCGVGGCTAALLLARQGHAITLFEQSPRVGPVGAGILLQSSGQAVLQSLGLLDAVTANAERIDELIAYNHHGNLLSRLRFADALEDQWAWGVHRGDLFGVLHRAVVDAKIDLRLNQTVAGVDADGQTPIDRSGKALGRFDLIVAADGSRSRLREACRMRAVMFPYRFAALWAVARDNAVRGRLLQHARHTHQLCGLLPMGGGRTSFFWGIESSEWPRMRRGSFAAWRQRVVDLMPPAEPLLETLRSFDELMFSTYRAVWMPSAARGRVVFIGDAAHASSPLLGHGINLAMCDAQDLADAMAHSGCVRSALQRYNATQRWRNSYYSLLSAALTPSFQGRSTAIGIARDFALPKLQRVPPLRYLMLRTLAGT